MLPRRDEPTHCEVCGDEIAATPPIRLADLRVCLPCQRGDQRVAKERWGLASDMHYKASGHRTSEHYSLEIKRPTFVEAFARFEREGRSKRGWFGRLFSKRDPEVGDEDFDERVFIDADPGAEESTLEVLGEPTLRRAVVALVELGCEVHLTGQAVWIYDRDDGIGAISDIAEVEPLATALAVLLERYARGELPVAS